MAERRVSLHGRLVKLAVRRRPADATVAPTSVPDPEPSFASPRRQRPVLEFNGHLFAGGRLPLFGALSCEGVASAIYDQRISCAHIGSAGPTVLLPFS